MKTIIMILIAIGFVATGFAFGYAVSTAVIAAMEKPTPAEDSLPFCDGELYTPGTCGVDSGMTFSQCKVNTTGVANAT